MYIRFDTDFLINLSIMQSINWFSIPVYTRVFTVFTHLSKCCYNTLEELRSNFHTINTLLVTVVKMNEDDIEHAQPEDEMEELEM